MLVGVPPACLRLLLPLPCLPSPPCPSPAAAAYVLYALSESSMPVGVPAVHTFSLVYLAGGRRAGGRVWVLI